VDTPGLQTSPGTRGFPSYPGAQVEHVLPVYSDGHPEQVISPSESRTHSAVNLVQHAHRRCNLHSCKQLFEEKHTILKCVSMRNM